MSSEMIELGRLNGHSVGIIMKELVRRAIMAIRNQKQSFEVHAKEGHSGNMDDMLTSADEAAQKVYVKSLRECFPTWGIIAEENALSIPCSDDSGLFFTVDPLDGTKAFVRRQSHGVGTMISLSSREGFLSGWVGDVNTQEIFGFRPGTRKVHRISEFNTNEVLKITPRPLYEQYVLLRDPEYMYSPVSRMLITSAFKNQEVSGGSIGTWLARLWKGEVGAVVIPPSVETPWDANPINAISLKLGFVYLQPTNDSRKWGPYFPAPLTAKVRRDHDILIVHESNLKELV